MPQLSMEDESSTTDFVGRDPGWIIKSGINLILLFFCMFFALSWIVKYPDTIVARVIISSSNPPIDLVAKVSGKVEKIFVQDNENVQTNTDLVLLESDLNYEAMLRLEKSLKLSNFSKDNIVSMGEYLEGNISHDKLGDLQTQFNQLLNSIDNYKILLVSEQLANNRVHIDSKIKHYNFLSSDLELKKNNRTQKLEIEKKVLNKHKKLLKSGLTSEANFIEIKSNYLDREVEIMEINNQKHIYKLEITQLKQNIEQFEIIENDKNKTLWNIIKQDRLALVNSIKEWKKIYLISAPISGKVSYSKRLAPFQYIIEKENVMSLVVSINMHKGEMVIKHERSGKVKPGQKVIVELDSLPANEYGRLLGTVESKGLVPTEKGITVTINLAKPVVTDYGYAIPESGVLYGTAKIITEDKRLISRFFEKVLYITKND